MYDNIHWTIPELQFPSSIEWQKKKELIYCLQHWAKNIRGGVQTHDNSIRMTLQGNNYSERNASRNSTILNNKSLFIINEEYIWNDSKSAVHRAPGQFSKTDQLFVNIFPKLCLPQKETWAKIVIPLHAVVSRHTRGRPATYWK